MNEVATEQKASGLSIAALICGIFGFVPPSALAALICGIVDLVRIKNKQSSPKGKGMDIAGIVLAVVMPILFWAVIWGAVIIPLISFAGSLGTMTT